MIRFCSLSSGSSGNCIFLGTENSEILVDAGISGSKIEKALNEIDDSCTKINAILVTHEHNDHICGAGILSRRYDIPVFATEGTWKSMNIGKISDRNQIVIDPSSGPFEIGDISVHPFRTPHDAADPVAYAFYAQGHKMAVATDIGHMTDEIRRNIEGSEILLLESNHDIDSLRYGRYPKALQERILGNYGHLSNDDASDTVVEMAKKGTKNILLGHLSHENNTPSLALETANRKLRENGFENGRNIFVSVAKRDVPTKLLTI